MLDDAPLRLGNWLNLLVAASVLAIGVYHYFRSKLLKEKELEFLKIVFAFWLGQWCVFVLIWLRIVSTYPMNQDYLVLILGDCQSMLAFGFSIAFLFGPEVRKKWGAILKGLVLTYVLLSAINAAASFGAFAAGSNSGQGFGKLFLSQWASTAQVLSLIADCLMGFAFVVRYGRLGLCMLAACVFYATLQSPIYLALFGSSPSGMEPPQIRFALAFGKALLGVIFYWLFLEKATNYGKISLALQPPPKFDWKGFARRGGTLVVLVVFVAAVGFKASSSGTPSSLGDTFFGLLTKLLAYIAVIIPIIIMLQPKLTTVRFVLDESIQTQPGDRIYLTGSCRELGDWWPGEVRGVAMDGSRYPTWTVEVDIPAKSELEFKFVKIIGGEPVWEHGAANHTYTSPGERSATLEKHWRWQH